MNWLVKLLGDPNEKKVKSMMGIVEHINALEQMMNCELKLKNSKTFWLNVQHLRILKKI